MDNSTIKDNIRKRRKAYRLTQEEMAHKLDISLTAYRDLEKGNTNIVNSNVIRIAELLGTTTEELVLGYRPVQAPGKLLEDVRAEYGDKIEVMKKRISDLEKLVRSQEETIATKNGLTLVECELITGRTHQIRAQFAHAGHPLLGDGKYGKLDKRFDRNYQALYSYKLTFTFTTDAGCLSYLDGKSFQVKDVEFVHTYFPDTTI